jgi:hypothetical protein
MPVIQVHRRQGKKIMSSRLPELHSKILSLREREGRREGGREKEGKREREEEI